MNAFAIWQQQQKQKQDEMREIRKACFKLMRQKGEAKTKCKVYEFKNLNKGV